jgi:MSHA biogenesis protein MshK
MDRAVMRARRYVAVASVLLSLAPSAVAQGLIDPTRPPDAIPAESAAVAARAAAPQLQSLLISNKPGGRRLAVIDGVSVRPGDRIGGAVLVSIGEASVVLRRGKTLETLRLYPKAAQVNDGVQMRRK